MIAKPLVLFGVLISIAGQAAFAEDANEGVRLLNEMNTALHELQYEGKLVHLKGSEVSTLAVKHFIQNGAEKEIIKPLDQNADQFIRESRSFSLTNLPPRITEEMKEVYSFDAGGMGKVAGRDCRIVLARPKDRKRYLQKFCIDSEYSLLLKYSLINQKHEPVERFMFADISINEFPVMAAEESPPIDSEMRMSAAAPGTPLNSLSSMQAPAAAMSEALPNLSAKQAPSNKVMSAWFFDPLPKGFKLLNYPKSNINFGEEHIVLSDGLSSVSVFISEGKKQTTQPTEIQSGALNILTRTQGIYSITLVGEVPKETLHEIFTGLKNTEE